jgi:ligand-binding sensor domain-containing protein/two-component sensor histidine kinase
MKLWLAFLLFLWAEINLAQDISRIVQTISVDEGLSQSSVNSIYQDKKGFLWIGTGDGLNRYDGKQIKIFKAPVDINEPSNANLIRGKITEDSKGNIWYTSENGLYEFNQDKFRIEKKHDFVRSKLEGSDYLLVFIDSRQNVWMYSMANGFACYNILSKKFETVPEQYSINGSQLVKQNFDVENDNIWFVLHRQDGIYRFDTRTKKTKHFFDQEDLRFVRFKKKGYYIMGANTLSRYDSGSQQRQTINNFPIEKLDAHDLVDDKFNRVWISTTNHGLWSFDFKKNKGEEFYTENSTGSLYNLTTLFIDRTQNLWVGTDGGGINRLDLKPPTFHLLTAHAFKASTFFIRTLVEDAEGMLWVLSLDNPIYVYDPKNREVISRDVINKINANKPLWINSDDDGNVWVDCESMIFIVDTLGNYKVYPNIFRKEDKSNKIYKIKYLNSGEICLVTTHGLFFLNGKTPDKGYRYTKQTSLHGIDFVETDDGSLWVATRNNGLFKNRRDKDGNYNEQMNFFPNLYIYSIHQDNLNPELFWLACDKGVIRFNRFSYEYQLYSEKEGINNGNVYNILEDTKNQLWCGTLGGIVRFNKSTKQFSNYTVKDGLQNNEFNSRAFFKGRSGYFYFGGVKGINWFKPEEIDTDTTTATVELSEVLVNDAQLSDSVLRGNKIVLPYFKNDLSCRFSVFDFSKPESNKIRYQLLAWDEKPVITYASSIVYNNLLPGNYTLVYAASTSNNHWGKEKKIAIVIESPFWQRWWFYLLVVLFITITLVVIVWFLVRQRYRMRIAELEKQNAIERERRRISMEIHDDIGANLTRISLISEAAKHHAEKEKALDQIAHTSRHVVTSMGEIIWSLNPDNKTFEQLMSYMRDQLHNLLEPTGINYQIELPETGKYLLSNTVKRNLILLVKEAVNNAVKHACATEIKVEGRMTGNNFEIQVIDNGNGFDSDHGFNGNGMRNAKIRVNEINGSLKINSVPGKGTKITFQIPIGLEELYH